MRYDYEWPLHNPPHVLDEALEIALDYLQRTGQAETGDGAEHLVAATILAAWKQGTAHPMRLANAAIVAAQQAEPPELPAGNPDIELIRRRFFDC